MRVPMGNVHVALDEWMAGRYMSQYIFTDSLKLYSIQLLHRKKKSLAVYIMFRNYQYRERNWHNISMVHLLGMTVSYYNRVSNKRHVKALAFKALTQNVTHLLPACSNEPPSKSTIKALFFEDDQEKMILCEKHFVFCFSEAFRTFLASFSGNSESRDGVHSVDSSSFHPDTHIFHKQLGHR
ncbi:hypothetical protein STEG23_001693, partial [Scotinomys teguina]